MGDTEDRPIATDTFELEGWIFAIGQYPMFNSEQIRVLSQGQCKLLPDALYGSNFLSIASPSNAAQIFFHAVDVLLGCHRPLTNGEDSPNQALLCPLKFEPEIPKVLMADAWKEYKDDRKAHLPDNIRECKNDCDWTFASNYWGSISLGQNPGTPTGQATHGKVIHGEEVENELPMKLLTCQEEKILWFQHIDFFEDDLSDCGMTRCSIRVRVMPKFWLLLMRIDTRVDGVVLKRMDTRVLHVFGKSHLLRQFIWSEASFEELLSRGCDLGPGSAHISHNVIGCDLLTKEDIRQKTMFRLTLSPTTS